MCILEAMACGCPTVAASVGGIPEMIEHGVNGLLFDRKEGVDKVVSLVRTITTCRDYQNTLSENGLRRVREKHTAEVMIDDYLRLYEEIVSNKPSKAGFSKKLYKLLLSIALGCRNTIKRKAIGK